MSSKPTTPSLNSREAARRRLLRSSGVYKILPQSPKIHYPSEVLPLESDHIQEGLRALQESLGELENNMCELAKIHSAVNSGFNEPFAAFLYGLLITMFCNNFPGCPTRDTYEYNQDNGQKERVLLLQKRVHAARAENERLKQQLASQSTSQRTIASRPALSGQNQAIRRIAVPSGPSFGNSTRGAPLSRQKKVVVAHDDTYSTTDSFVDIPSSSKLVSRIQKPAAAVRPGSLNSTGPNLDQPPRYMRGLFDKTSSSNVRRNLDTKTRARGPTTSSARRQVERASRLAGRPPFR